MLVTGNLRFELIQLRAGESSDFSSEVLVLLIEWEFVSKFVVDLIVLIGVARLVLN